jgi:hypothetical protein
MLSVPLMGNPYQTVGNPVAAVIVEPTMSMGLGHVQSGPPQSALQT